MAPENPEPGTPFDTAYATMGHGGSVALHNVSNGLVAYQVNLPSATAQAVSVAVEQDIGYDYALPCGAMTTGNATVATAPPPLPAVQESATTRSITWTSSMRASTTAWL